MIKMTKGIMKIRNKMNLIAKIFQKYLCDSLNAFLKFSRSPFKYFLIRMNLVATNPIPADILITARIINDTSSLTIAGADATMLSAASFTSAFLFTSRTGESNPLR